MEPFPSEASKTQGFCVLTELCLALVRAQTGQSMDELAQELSAHLGKADESMPFPPSANGTAE